MRNLPRRFSDWVVVHPVLWGVGSGVLLVLLGFALNLAPIVVIAAGAAIGVLNILHAKRRATAHIRQSRVLTRYERRPSNRSGNAATTDPYLPFFALSLARGWPTDSTGGPLPSRSSVAADGATRASVAGPGRPAGKCPASGPGRPWCGAGCRCFRLG